MESVTSFLGDGPKEASVLKHFTRILRCPWQVLRVLLQVQELASMFAGRFNAVALSLQSGWVELLSEPDCCDPGAIKSQKWIQHGLLAEDYLFAQPGPPSVFLLLLVLRHLTTCCCYSRIGHWRPTIYIEGRFSFQKEFSIPAWWNVYRLPLRQLVPTGRGWHTASPRTRRTTAASRGAHSGLIWIARYMRCNCEVIPSDLHSSFFLISILGRTWPDLFP